MSLQFDSVRLPFVAECAATWRDWLQGPAAGRSALREAKFRASVRHMTAFMLPPTVVFQNLTGWGAFEWPSWTLHINAEYTARDDIRYEDFVEICSTVYHETRHAEQFFRIAQGLAAGTLTFPDASKARTVQAMAAGAGGVRSRIALFEAASNGSNLLQQDPVRGMQTIANWLNVPERIARHAYSHRDYFARYLASARPAWFKRPTILDEVNEWMRATYKKTYSEVDTWAQGADGPYRIYRDLPEENDAHGIENLVQQAIYRSIGHDTHAGRQSRRNDPHFWP